jgi:EAL domain-containing protein (putative c-di-GMP-specific phosphodiesterase class I)
MGYPLVIDDFAMGYTSIKYLQGNEFDMVKLDGSLVREMDNPRNNEIITSIVSLAKALGFTVLGEYVETREQQIQLEKLGCTRYQGYLYSPAVPFEDFLKKMKETPGS